MSKDKASEARILSTTNELYISGPYFSDFEAERIRSAIVEGRKCSDGEDTNMETAMPEDQRAIGLHLVTKPNEATTTLTIEQAIQDRLSNFLEKRRASGDARPCGPHDLGPVYKEVFGIPQAELKDEQFLVRMRKSGLGKPGKEPSKRVRDKEMGKKSTKKGKLEGSEEAIQCRQ
ncbi:hypothetical protein LTS18_006791 [Coniosporium uncinatum]|uniref:Uncharacterized protein n=1 Tax=Coniosporium uncinatum TaxID=93489 RepID=A0ACC3DAL9_9PEZI|nr:hypothetical protein LTS18_006791 [Coniosporium uncinatum]